jgi:mannose-1-phosphate guanylyltransferase
VRAVVLAGGEGTRLRPLTFDTPKPLLPVAGRSMIERVLDHLAAHGVSDAVLSLGYRPDAFYEAFPDGIAGGVRLSYAVEPSPLDTAGAVRFAALTAGIDEPFVVVNVDVLTDLDVSALIGFHRERRAHATVALTPVEEPSSYGVVVADGHGAVSAFVEKPPPGTAPTNLINAGTYVLEPSVLERIATGRRVSIERETFPGLAAEGKLFARASDAYWVDTGTPADLLRAGRDLLDGRRPGHPLPGSRLLAPGVYAIGEPACHGRLEPPSLVGDRAVVDRGALVSASVVSEGAVVEEAARVVGSLVLPGARVRHGAQVHHSIIGWGSTVGEEAVIEGASVIGRGVEIEPRARLGGARLPAGEAEQVSERQPERRRAPVLPAGADEAGPR